MWKTLNEEQKIEYKKYCDTKYGKTIVSCETGEPMYMENIHPLEEKGIFSRIFR